ncbi:uncharacterized protein PV07_03324 [Cladophialophora immunda]|uniref:Zn(2)-C6 fungal-type domain-containing protein n=1 Tax=Cladophialophora immunda TaxID=569365 RepID=A0A0D2D7J7_9EURO|nr:uncharacterized protein PV07_03324 [Cladophialophora immunda]KIW31724.1 hypothetical protein PV07_03324 [Cladophialophora immunda]OQV01359.1 Fungal Zn2-Cys6 binuclear cluster domain-containing protein [Cladophialophora immunda]
MAEPATTQPPAAVLPVILPSAPKGWKRRASAACSYCQWRKIRCNVEAGIPCNNCKLENVVCRITKRRMTKQDRAAQLRQQQQQQQQQQQPPPPAARAMSASTNPNVIEPNAQMRTPLPQIVPFQSASVRSVERQSIERPIPLADLESSPVLGISSETSHQGNSKDPAFPRSPSLRSAHSSSTTIEQIQRRLVNKPTLPGYFAPVPDHLANADLEYLQKKGSFDIPSDGFRDAVLCSYAEFVHIYMPVLSIDDFLMDVAGLRGFNGSVSLLLFQAVMFLGCAHVDIKLLRMMGFLTRKAARRALYQRTKALYYLGYEQNRIQVIQALLLLSTWYDIPDDQEDGYHWLQIAVGLAHREGLSKDPTPLDMSESEKHVRKCLWWCLLNRDPLLAVGAKRPISIRPHDWNVPEPALDDWKVQDTAGLKAFTLDWSRRKWDMLRTVFVSQCKLHRHLSKIMADQYVMAEHHSHRHRTSVDPTSTRVQLMPVTTDEAWVSMRESESNLRTWRENLPPDLESTQVPVKPLDENLEAFAVMRAMLHLLYHLSIISMYRPWLRHPHLTRGCSPASTEEGFQDMIRTSIRTSAHSITELVVELHNADLARHLPQSVLSCMIASIVIHISDLCSKDESLQEPALRDFEQTSHIINELRENYYSADFLGDFVDLVASTKRLCHRAPVRSEPLRSRTFVTFNLEDQSTAFQKFLGEEEDPKAEPATETAVPAPNAPFPNPTELPPGVSPLAFHEGFWGLMEEPTDAAQSWQYLQNFHAESAGLLGEISEEHQFNFFNPIPGVDIET